MVLLLLFVYNLCVFIFITSIFVSLLTHKHNDVASNAISLTHTTTKQQRLLYVLYIKINYKCCLLYITHSHGQDDDTNAHASR